MFLHTVISVSILLTSADSRPKSETFTVVTVDNQFNCEQFVGVTEAGQLVLDKHQDEVTLENLVSVRRLPGQVSPLARNSQVVLANGDRLTGQIVDGNTRAIRLKSELAQEPIDIPLNSLAAIWFQPLPKELPADPKSYPFRASVRRGDVILYTNGDTDIGTLESFETRATGIQLREGRNGSRRRIMTEGVAAIVIDPLLSRLRTPREPAFRVVMADGSRITLKTVQGIGGSLVGETLFGAEVKLPIADLVAMDTINGPADYLDQLKPQKQTVEPFISLSWPWTINQTVKGEPIRLGGNYADGQFDFGLGTHPKTTLTYNLGKKYQRFETKVGLDPVTGRRGSAKIQVYLDGKPVLDEQQQNVTADMPAQELSLDVAGVKEMQLEVDFGPTGDVQADVNWADARLIKVQSGK